MFVQKRESGKEKKGRRGGKRKGRKKEIFVQFKSN